MNSPRTRSAAWKALEQHQRALSGLHLRNLFREDPARFERFSIEAAGLFLDYSKHRVTAETLRLLIALARECELEARIRQMLAGEHVNFTENRAALHVALRAAEAMPREGHDLTGEVRGVLAKMRRFCDGLRSGEARGATGEHYTDVVNIGIGGSDLGPALACEALAPYATPPLKSHFVSNVDGHASAAAMA